MNSKLIDFRIVGSFYYEIKIICLLEECYKTNIYMERQQVTEFILKFVTDKLTHSMLQ